MKFKDLKLGTKQMVGFSIVLLILTSVNFFMIHKMRDLRSDIDEVSMNWLPQAIAISDINLNTSKLRINQLQYSLTSNQTKKQELSNTIIAIIDKIDENKTIYEKLKTNSEAKNLYSDEEGNLYSAFDDKWEEYQDLSFTWFQLSNENKNREAADLLNGEAQDVFSELSAHLVDLVAVNKRDSFLAAKRADITFKSTRGIATILIIATIAFSIFIAGVLVRWITVPVTKLEKAAGKVARGDLDVQLDVESKDEIGNLAHSFNQMTVALKQAKEKTESQAKKLKVQNMELEQTLRELKETQEQLLLKEKMASVGNLVAGIAHSINNPIGSVNSSIDVLNRCTEKIETILRESDTLDELKMNKDMPKVLRILRSNIQVSQTAGKRIETIVKSLKNFTRLDEAEYQKTDIHKGLDSSLTLIENELQDRITVVKKYGEIPEIICFPGQLNQAFLYLLKNAVTAIEKTGTIGIKTFQHDSQIHIEISDSGIGIPREKLENIFEFGFSTDQSRVKMASGLSTAYNIIQKHSGDIKVESEVDKGTTIFIILPIK